METLPWSDFVTGLTQHPLETLLNFGSVVAHNFIAHWWIIMIMIAGFWGGRILVFNIFETIIPKRLGEVPPAWSGNRFMHAWHRKLYNDALESRSLQRSRAVVSLAKSFIDPLMFFIAFLSVFAQLGMVMTVATGSILLGAVSLALGLGMQGVIKDILSGLTILVTDAYAVGDYIDVQFGVAGTVTHIGLRLTTLEGTDGTFWYVRHSEVPKVGNLTAAKALVITDVTFTWSEDHKQVTSSDLHFVEDTLESTTKDLAIALEEVNAVAQAGTMTSGEDEVFQRMVTVLPDLVPTLGDDTLKNMRAIRSGDGDNSASLIKVVEKLPNRVPIFTLVEALGLTNATKDSITLRLRITLPPKSSRSKGMAVLRRAVFEAFTPFSITPSFSDVAEHELPALSFHNGEMSPRGFSTE